MNKEQKELLGDYAIGVIPEGLQYCLDNLIDKNQYPGVDYSIKNLGQAGTFWKAIKPHAFVKIGDDNKITIQQPSLGAENGCLIFLMFAVESVDVTFKDGKKKNVVFQKSNFHDVLYAPVDFMYSNPIIEAVFHFYMNMTDDLKCSLETTYVEAPVVDVKKECLKKADIKVSTGESLINVYFQEASNDYGFTKVELYIGDQNHFNLISKKRVEEGNYYCSFNNLAFGTYGIKVIQFDNKENVIVESEIISVKLNPPDYSGKPTIII